MIKVFPYTVGSRSAKKLAEACGGRVLRRKGSKYRYREGDLIINWGASDCPFKGKGVANQPEFIHSASNKLKFFQLAKEAGVSIPPFFVNKQDIPDDAFPVMCRKKLQAHSGEGIVIANNRDELVDAPLFTQYVKKKEEFRVHCVRKPGEAASVIFVQRKAKKIGIENANFKIRNLANGFVYMSADDWPACVEQEALKALEATGLAFGGIDVIWNQRSNKAYVLESNTAPGLEERTAKEYAKVFKEIAR